MQYSFSASFLEKMNAQIRISVENRLAKQLDWNKLLLFSDPSESLLYLCKRVEDDIKYYSLVCSISNEMGINYDGQIIWTNALTKEEFDFEADVTDIPIAFMWIPDPDSEEDGLRLPSFVEKSEKGKLKLKSKLKFTVSIDSESMPHEGKFAITLWNSEDVDNVSRVLEQAREGWNNQTDKARETGDESMERGYCHNIGYDGISDKVAYWYVDAGSAHDRIHEFLLKGLSDSGIKIKHVEILGL